MRVVCVGLATVDLVQRVERLPGVDEKAEALSADVAAGGPATNAAVTAAALGASVTLVTAVGAHPLGALIRADVAACGVSLLDAAPRATAPPPVSAVTVVRATGQRTIVSRNARGADVTAPPGLADVLGAADIVLVDGHHPALARAAAACGRPLLLDAGSWRPVFADLLGAADVVAASAAFRMPGAAAAGTGAALRAAGVRRGAITNGPDPVAWWSGDRGGELPVPGVPAVDTAGAGDVFHGALAVALARDPDLLPALRYAVRIAGIRVRHAGPRAWLDAVRSQRKSAPGHAPRFHT
ncbi:PfkB family carbohydrate kinase [Amorphoplanes digitatis]|uniref:Sugar/nucleoside kinase (Ribokinase family) n=1 Tax=Actinoplanes digitatis TaxID=1868 RepID=A0A7W7HY85_9ACTN|nr:PfkB family carbohydrate kinase [Actinoplanes digitatis]MBB4762873.1 sugar/nucleoside kinase (ribokinase family) [Actinoplanes digitatis]GID91632.1 kinase [Actinoplanes digitatis]